MPVQIVNDNIKREILKHLNSAEFSIYVSVAWISDKDIFEVLCQKAKADVTVEVIIRDDYKAADSINFRENSIDFAKLEFFGGKVFLLEGHHNKYCVIDLKIYINGSYNWTWTASKKDDGLESIDIHFNEYQTAYEKAGHFKKLRDISKQLALTVSHTNVFTKDSLNLKIKEWAKLDRNIAKIMMEDGAEFYITRKDWYSVWILEENTSYAFNSEVSIRELQGLNFVVKK